MKEYFLSCDWGSTLFRLKLVDAVNHSIIAEEKNHNGIVTTHELWKSSKQDDSKRLDFYINILQKHILNIETKLGTVFTDVPLVISGMASSTLGMIELAY